MGSCKHRALENGVSLVLDWSRKSGSLSGPEEDRSDLVFLGVPRHSAGEIRPFGCVAKRSWLTLDSAGDGNVLSRSSSKRWQQSEFRPTHFLVRLWECVAVHQYIVLTTSQREDERYP